MDETGAIGWLGWVIIGAVIGLGMGWERATSGDLVERMTFGLKLAFAVVWATMVASEVETVRGFAVVFLSSVGAYKIAALVGELIGWRWGPRLTR